MRRRLLIIATFLMAGSVLNVAVAWRCALWSPLKQWLNLHDFITFPGQEDVRSVPVRVLALHEQHRPPVALSGRTLGAAGYGYDVYVIQEWDHSGHSLETSAACAGWPARAFWAYDVDVHEAGINHEYRAGLIEAKNRWIPYMPLWPGVLANTLMYAAFVSAPFVVRQLMRRRHRLCPYCGYPIGKSRICSECGNPLAANAASLHLKPP